MTKPTTRHQFATDATFASDGDDWGGDANKVDPGATRFAEGYEPDRLPAEWLNYHLNSLGEHVEYIHDVLEGLDDIPSGSTRTIILPGSAFILESDSAGSIQGNFGGASLVTGSGAELALGLNRLVPHGATDLSVDVLIRTASTDQTTAATLTLRRITHNFSTPAIGSNTTSDSDTSGTGAGAALDVLNVADATGLDDPDELVHIALDVGTITGTFFVYAIRVQFTDPGPRNY